MDATVAKGAVLVAGLGQVMRERRVSVALKAEKADLVPRQHLRIGGPVGPVAPFAAESPAGGMLEDKGPLRLLVAFTADVLCAARAKLAEVKAAVRLVTTGALHEAFRYRVTEGHRKFHALLCVALEAETRLLVRQHFFDHTHLVKALGARGRVALVAGDLPGPVIATEKIESRLRAPVTGQTLGRSLFGRFIVEGDDTFLRKVLSVFRTWAVACLAAAGGISAAEG
jgi:hypothetical protein